LNANLIELESSMKARELLHHSDPSHHTQHPYWKRAHRDWRFWLGVVCMFVAIFLYVMRDQAVFVPSRQPKKVGSESSAAPQTLTAAGLSQDTYDAITAADQA
jgi:hypothetical protein